MLEMLGAAHKNAINIITFDHKTGSWCQAKDHIIMKEEDQRSIAGPKI